MEDIKPFALTRQLFPRSSNSSLARHCQRSCKFQPKTKHVVNFLMLRQSGERLDKALAFSIKRSCRYDTTQSKDGTFNFRILKRKKTDQKYIHYGWAMNGEPEIENKLPEINHIFLQMEEQDRLIKQLVNTKVESNY